MNTILVILLSLTLGFVYRIRGGSLSLANDSEGRAIWSTVVGIICMSIAYICGIPIAVGILGITTAFISVSIGHSFAQGPRVSQYLEMGLIGYTRAAITLLPLWIYQIFFDYKDIHIGLFTASLIGWFQGLAYMIGYEDLASNGFKLRLFGIDWCVPGEFPGYDASWGEFLTGYVFAAMFIMIALTYGVN